MSIITDDHTPVRATAAAQGVNVARASVQLPDPLCSHWQTDLNRFVAGEYQLFRTQSFVKRRKMEALLQTCGENISLSIPPKASFPDLLGKLKASEGKYRSVEEKLKATEQQAFISENFKHGDNSSHFTCFGVQLRFRYPDSIKC